MNTQSNNELIISGIHLELTPSLKTYIKEKTDRLFKHAPKVFRIRVDLECDMAQDISRRFKAKGIMEMSGPDMNASVASDEAHKAISLLVDNLDRMLRKSAAAAKGKRNAPKSVDIGTGLPKVS